MGMAHVSLGPGPWREFVPGQLGPALLHVPADRHADRLLVGPQPSQYSLALRLADACDGRRPALPEAIHPFDQLCQREDSISLQSGGDGRVQPGANRVAGSRRLRDKALQPAQGLKLPLHEASATRLALTRPAELGHVRLHLLGL